MNQIHRHFSDEQIRVLLQSYCQRKITRDDLEDMLGIAKTRFFALLKSYRQNPHTFSITYRRITPARLSSEVEAQVQRALLEEKQIIENPDLPISDYNYTALKDRLNKRGVEVSVTTIIDRAKKLNCHKPRNKKKSHEREVLTASIGALVQHDASLHQWSPFAQEKWALITSIDDYSRKILFADLFAKETTWAHVQATQTLIQTYGLPLRYYVDSLRVFRFVQGRDSFWRKHVLQTDDVDTQWRKMMRILGVEVIFALSPQAKGKVERPYRWLQDRIVRTCAYERLSTIEQVRPVLREEVHRYNNYQVHSTTGEIPNIRFKRASQTGNSLFRKFTIPRPYSSAQDVFCLREKRTTDGYRRISLFNHPIPVPNTPPYQDVTIHLVPDIAHQIMNLRIWWNDKMVHSLSLPLQTFRVHF